MEKYNALQIDGWLLLRYTAKDVKAGAAIDGVRAVIAERAFAVRRP